MFDRGWERKESKAKQSKGKTAAVAAQTCRWGREPAFVRLKRKHHKHAVYAWFERHRAEALVNLNSSVGVSLPCTREQNNTGSLQTPAGASTPRQQTPPPSWVGAAFSVPRFSGSTTPRDPASLLLA